MEIIFFSTYTSGRTVKIKYEFDDDGDGNFAAMNPNIRRFTNFVMYKMWVDFGVTGHLQFPTVLEFPNCEVYPTHYTIEVSHEEFRDFCNQNKETQNADF